MNTRTLLVVFFFLLCAKQEIYSQFGFSHEVGIITGPVAFFSDYGVRSDFETNKGNVGFGIGLVHYINFSYRADCNCYTRDTYFNDHFKIRNEIDYHKTNLDYFGEFAEDDDDLGAYLRATSGSTTVFDIGSQLEYFPLSIRDFAAGGYKIAPFISAGVHYVSFDPESTEPSPLSIPTPSKYIDAYQQEGGSTFSVVGSIGFRFKLTPVSDLMLDSRWQYYFSDWVDGLNPGFDQNEVRPVPENKSNDWIYWLNVGYIYYLD